MTAEGEGSDPRNSSDMKKHKTNSKKWSVKLLLAWEAIRLSSMLSFFVFYANLGLLRFDYDMLMEILICEALGSFVYFVAAFIFSMGCVVELVAFDSCLNPYFGYVVVSLFMFVLTVVACNKEKWWSRIMIWLYFSPEVMCLVLMS